MPTDQSASPAAKKPRAALPRSAVRRPFFASRPAPVPRDARQAALAEWRGLDLDPLERAWADQSQPVAAVLNRVVAELNLDRRLAEAEVFKAWGQLVDPAVAAHAQPAGLRNGTLFVNVDSSVWLNEIVRYRRREILDRLQHAFGPDMVAKISFRVG